MEPIGIFRPWFCDPSENVVDSPNFRDHSENVVDSPSSFSPICWRAFLFPSEITIFRTPKKYKFSGPLWRRRRQGGVDIKWNGPLLDKVYIGEFIYSVLI